MTGKRARRAEAALRSEVALAAADRHGGPADGTHGSRASGGRHSSKRSGADFDAAKASSVMAAAAPEADVQHPDQAAAAADPDVAYVVPDDAVVRRTKDGWRVGSDELPDLTCAMVLADLLAAESGMTDRLAKPSLDLGDAGETGKLRATVGQLEHALLTRIRVEQAIGVLAERHRIKPRQAFEQLREAARSRGRKVIDIATDVVASATNPLLQLPEELSRPRSGPRRPARQSFSPQ
jgi:ANTAR domain